ncbi:conserved protein, unknown function [Plasmodium sp. gorilla clade G2]|uniref:conserved protein, unknown function n=1 Tax=Plasmodium sp. gorilla clade G2 TaxID=880535 RepID=UPI000D211E81|nr:conserved protein, unknown function [Plasmodium sp. gorilla clade G2]SOV18148.1 conserved protein, unknown function [Plasmodium sp. gorilla clade G2]
MLRVETKTWTRDSHDLFDYEAQQVNKKSFLISTAIKLFRSKAQVSCVADSPECLPNTTQDYLLSVRPQEDKYVITPAEHSLSNQYNIKKLWIIVKDLPEKYYALHENDIIKLGRFRLKVRQFIESVDTLNTLKLDDCPSKKCEMILDSSNIQCRICLIEGNQENDPLICPCDCKGSIKYAHLMCLRKWINGRLNLNDQLFSGSVFIKDICCELCKSKYPKSIKQNEELVQLVKIPNLKTPLIVLDNIIGQTSKGVHLISFADKKYLKLGRGHESDVRIPDVSISRYHATIKYEKGLFKLEDHNSKFGTLVALRKAREIYPKDTMSLQVGRSVVQFKMDEEIPFKSGIIDIIENKEVLDSSEAPTNDKSTVNSAPPVNTTSNTDETNNRNNFERNQFMDITNASNSLQSSYSPYRVDNLMSLLNYQNEYRIFGIRNCYNLMENRNNQQLIPQMNFVPGSNIDMNNDEINNDQHLLHHRDSHIQANADEVAHNDCEETQQPRDISNQSNDDNDDDDEEEENHVNDQNDDDEDNNDNDHNDNNNSGGGSSSGSSDNNSNSNRGGNNNSQYYGNNSNNNNNNSNSNNSNNNSNNNNNNNNYNNNYNNNCNGRTDYSDISSTPKKNTIKDYNKFNKIHVGNLPIDISNIYESNNGPKDIVSNSDFIKNSSTPYSIRKNKLSYNNDLLKQKNKCHDMDETVEKILSRNENKYEKESLSNNNKNEIYTNYNMDENNSSFFFSNMKTPSVIDFFKYDNSSSVSYNQSKTRMDERYKNGKLVEEYNNNDKKLKKNSSSSSNIYHKNNYHTINRNNHMDNIIKKDQHLNNSKFVQDNDEYNINDKITTRSSLNCNKINISKDISSFNNFSLGTSNVSNINLYNTYELYNSDIVHYMYPNEDTKNDNNCSTPRKYMRYENNRIDDMNNKFNEINTHNVDKKIFKDTPTRKYSYTNINKMNQNNYMKNEYNNNNLSGSINCIETNFTYNNIREKFSYNNKMIKGNTLKKNYMSNSCDEINTCNKKMKKNLTEEIKENKDNILNVEERLEKSINNNNNIEIDLNEKTSSNSYQNFKSAVFKKRMIGSPYTNINTYKNDIPNESFNLNMKEKSYNELETYHSLPNVNINSNNVLNKFNDNKKYSHNNINNNRTYKLYNKHQTGISTDKSNKINQLNGKKVYVCTSKRTSNQSCDVYRKNEDSNHDDEHITSSECRRKSNAQHVIPLNEEIKNNDKIFSDYNVKNDMNEKYKNVKNNKHRLSTYDNLSHKRRMNNIKIDNCDHYSKNKCNNGSLKNKNIEKHSSYNFENDSKDLTPNQVDSSSSHLDNFVNEQKKQMKDIQRTISMVTIQDEDNNILNNLQEENNNNLNINNGSKLKNKSTCEDDKGTQLKYKNITSTNYDHKYNNLFAMKDNNTSNHNIYMNQQKKRCTAKY